MEVDVNAVNNNGNTPLHFAARHNLNEAVTFLLLRIGAEVNAINGNRETPLHLAARKNKNEAVTFLLLDNGADVDPEFDTCENKVELF